MTKEPRRTPKKATFNAIAKAMNAEAIRRGCMLVANPDTTTIEVVTLEWLRWCAQFQPNSGESRRAKP